jgi:predicted small lipoprotein YifL
MKRSRRAALAILALALASCGRAGPPLYPVRGKVTYKGQPAAGAAVHFRRDGDAGPGGATFPVGIVDEAGDFRLEMPDGASGAPAGRYKVLVLWPEAAKVAPAPTKGARPGKSAPETVASADRNGSKSVVDRLKYRYFSVDKPLLEAEVRPESNELQPFVLKD